jgi:hydroxyacylglutathione hydrolase
VNVPVSGSSFSTKAGFVLDAAHPIVVLAADAGEALRAVAGLRSVAFAEIPGYVLGGGDETTASVATGELDALIESGATVIDVREKDERDEGYIPESRHIPYRLVGEFADELANGKPVVTVCNTGARAAVAASVLAAHGIDARPVLDSGVPDWEQRGNPVTAFRRCGSG